MTDICFTDHAAARYRQRVRDEQPLDVVAAKGRIQQHAPSWAPSHSHNPDCWLIYRKAAFPLQRDQDGHGHDRLVAITCIARPQLPKADRRALRETARDQWAA